MASPLSTKTSPSSDGKGKNRVAVGRAGSSYITAPGSPHEVRVNLDDDDFDHEDSCCKMFGTSLRISWSYTWADIRRRPRNFCIGVTSVFFIVFFIGVIIAAIGKTSYLILRLSELSVGEMDVVVQAGGTSTFMNFTDLQLKLANSRYVEGIAPRWLARATLASQSEVQKARKESNDAIIADHQNNSNPQTYNTSYSQVGVTVFIIDSELEKKVGIGRAWRYREIGYSETQVWYSAANYVNVRANTGERVTLSIKPADLLTLVSSDLGDYRVYRPSNVSTIGDFLLEQFFSFNNITTDYIEPVKMVQGELALTLADGIEHIDGKYSAVIGNVALLDYRQLLPLLVDESCLSGPQLFGPSDNAQNIYFPSLTSLLGIDKLLDNIKLLENVYMTIAMLRDRFDMYYSSQGKRTTEMITKTNGLMYEVGVGYNGSVTYPISTAVTQFDIVTIMMTAAFITVIIGVVMLDIILVFTLLQTNAEERQFELAMIRSQGMRKTTLITLLLFECITFSIPGILIGVSLLFAANAIAEAALVSFTRGVLNTTRIELAAIITPIILGVVLPLGANWAPITNALKASLRDALDVYRQTQNEARVVMMKLSEMGLELWQFILAIFLVIVGFFIYYLAPYSFLSGNYMIFFIVMDIVLIWMLLGLGMVTYVIQPYASRFFLWVFLWGKDRRLHTLICKNMKSHSARNAWAYMMFLVSVTAIVAAGATFAALGDVSRQLTELITGADVMVTATFFDSPLDRETFDVFLSEQQEKGIVVSWTYTSFPLASYPQVVSRTRVGNIIGWTNYINVISVSDTFMNTVFKDYLMVKATDNSFPYPSTWYGGKDIVRSMSEYPAVSAASGKTTEFPLLATGLPPNEPVPNVSKKLLYTVSMMMSSYATDKFGMTVGSGGTTLTYTYTTNTGYVSTKFFVNVRALMNRVSGFMTITSLPLAFSSGYVLLPERDFKNLINPIPADYDSDSGVNLTSNAVTEIKYQGVYVRLNTKISTDSRSAFINSLQGLSDPISHVSVDAAAVTGQLQTVTNLIMYFFYFISVICIILCTFMMWLTFVANVQIHAWMYGVLQSLGFTYAQLTRSAIYEALSIVVPAFVLGFAVGIIAAVTLVVQINTFMVLPFKFNVPYPLILIILGLSLIAAVVGSIIPFISMRKKTIASILKGV